MATGGRLVANASWWKLGNTRNLMLHDVFSSENTGFHEPLIDQRLLGTAGTQRSSLQLLWS